MDREALRTAIHAVAKSQTHVTYHLTKEAPDSPPPPPAEPRKDSSSETGNGLSTDTESADTLILDSSELEGNPQRSPHYVLLNISNVSNQVSVQLTIHLPV